MQEQYCATINHDSTVNLDFLCVSSHMQMVEYEMLGFSSGLLGQSLIDNMAGKNAIRREALSAFLNSARFVYHHVL